MHLFMNYSFIHSFNIYLNYSSVIYSIVECRIINEFAD